MNRYGKESLARFITGHWLLQLVFLVVLQKRDHSILQGERSIEEQEKLFEQKLTKVKKGKHNEHPSMAYDAGPYFQSVGFRWPDLKFRPATYHKEVSQFYNFAGYVLATADALGIPIRWGGDWDGDAESIDQDFDDLVHFELVTADLPVELLDQLKKKYDALIASVNQ